MSTTQTTADHRTRRERRKPDPAALAHAEFAAVPDACSHFGLSRSHLYVLRAEGRVRFAKVGKRALVEMASVRALLAGHES